MRLIFFLSFTFLISTKCAFAVKPFAASDAEVAVLPKYCEVKLRKERPSYEQQHNYWSNIFGKDDWNNMHHYCYALYHINRYYSELRPADRRHYAKVAINNLDYVINRATPNFKFLPEILVKKGTILSSIGEKNKAIMLFNDAIRINPKYAPPYKKLSQIYIDNNQFNEAKSILEKGIKNIPKSKSLKRRLRRLKNTGNPTQ